MKRRKYVIGRWNRTNQHKDGNILLVKPYYSKSGKLCYQYKWTKGFPKKKERISIDNGYVKMKSGSLNEKPAVQQIEVQKDATGNTTQVIHKTFAENEDPKVEIKKIKVKDEVIDLEGNKLEFNEKGLYDKTNKKYVGH